MVRRSRSRGVQGRERWPWIFLLALAPVALAACGDLVRTRLRLTDPSGRCPAVLAAVRSIELAFDGHRRCLEVASPPRALAELEGVARQAELKTDHKGEVPFALLARTAAGCQGEVLVCARRTLTTPPTANELLVPSICSPQPGLDPATCGDSLAAGSIRLVGLSEHVDDQGQGAPQSVPLPLGVQAGDLLLVIVHSELPVRPTVAHAAATPLDAAYVADGSELTVGWVLTDDALLRAGKVTVEVDDFHFGHYFVEAWRGVDPRQPIDAYEKVAVFSPGALPLTNPQIRTSVDRVVLVELYGYRGEDQWSERPEGVNQRFAGAGGGTMTMINDELLPRAGLSPERAVAGGSYRQVSFTIGLRPESP